MGIYEQVYRPQVKAPPKWQLAGRQVTQAMYYDAEKARRDGKRVILVSAGTDNMTADIEDCANCDGFGQFALEIIVKGPFKTAPQGKPNSGEEAATVPTRPAWHNGAWYLVDRKFYICPFCSGKDEIVL